MLAFLRHTHRAFSAPPCPIPYPGGGANPQDRAGILVPTDTCQNVSIPRASAAATGRIHRGAVRRRENERSESGCMKRRQTVCRKLAIADKLTGRKLTMRRLFTDHRALPRRARIGMSATSAGQCFAYWSFCLALHSSQKRSDFRSISSAAAEKDMTQLRF